MSELDATFKPFENNLDLKKTLFFLKASIQKVDDGELFLERSQNESFLFDNKKLKQSSFSSKEGFGIRAVKGERTAYSHSSEINIDKIRNASESISLSNKESDLIKKNKLNLNNKSKRIYSNENPFHNIELSKKIQLLKKIDEYTRQADKNIKQVSVSLNASLQEVFILKPEEQILNDIRPMVRIYISVIIEENGRRESGSSGGGGRYNLSEIMKEEIWKNHVNEAIRIAKVNLNAKPAPAGVMDIVLGSGWPGVMLHEAVGHGLEGDFNRKKTSAFTDLIGKKVASENVTVIDDGTIPDRRGSITFDDEGSPSKKNILIENGILKSYMQDRQNARLMNTWSTGNGRRQSFAHPPMPRMTNTFMSSGKEDPKNLLKELKDGIYAVGFSGGQVDITNGKFVFSCTEAYKVENGNILYPVKGATLIGDGPSAMKKIQGIGNDLSLDAGIGNCGKAGQWVPVGVGQPTVYISGLTVGGRSI
ncbi:MAG: metalloprotease TldD [Paracoccaceae bacterium]